MEERELSRMSKEELEEYCKKLQIELTIAQWFLVQKRLNNDDEKKD